jgi:CTP:molybdopterin cytidylyltransferase MocA
MPERRVAAVVLAAGASRRLGQAKQLIQVEGESLLHRTARLALAAGCAPVCVVLGFDAARMRGEVAELAVEVLVNEGWAEGMGSSLRCGVAGVRDADAVLVLVCDQPRLPAGHLQALLALHKDGDAPITASAYGGRAGVPAVFGAEVLAELLAVEGDRGAREVIRRDAGRVQSIVWPEGILDVDLPADLKRMDRS